MTNHTTRKLNMQQTIALHQFLTTNSETLKSETYVDIAETATQQLKFAVSSSTVQLMNAEMGLGLGKPRARITDNSKTEDKLVAIARAVRDIRVALGMAEDDDLRTIIHRRCFDLASPVPMPPMFGTPPVPNSPPVPMPGRPLN